MLGVRVIFRGGWEGEGEGEGERGISTIIMGICSGVVWKTCREILSCLG